MLICPQCQFENPDTHKFCQGCGLPLTYKVCSECGTHVQLDALQCHNCNARTGTVWWVIVTPSIPTDLPSDQSSETLDNSLWQQLEDQPADSAALPDDLYLDPQQRYRILAVFPSEAELSSELQLQVLDCQPLQMSSLNAGDMPTVSAPTLAQPYIALRAKFHQSLPKLHDAWIQDQRQVMLLENRVDLPQLVDLWSDVQTSQLELLHWLHEMAELWVALEPWQCRQSLLDLNNLRIDEDGVLCLQRLYVDTSTTPISWQGLGRLWQELFSHTQRTQIGELASLIYKLASGEIRTLHDLQAQLEAIAHQLQGSVPEVPDTPPLFPAFSMSTFTSEEGNEEPTMDFSLSPHSSSLFPGATVPGAASANQDANAEDNDANEEEELEEYEDTPTMVLPMQLFSMEEVGRTDTGQQRDHNEDCFGLQTEIKKSEGLLGRTIQARGIFILCDGMGGHASGEVASNLAVETLKQYFKTHWLDVEPVETKKRHLLPSEEKIREGIILANQAIYDLNQQGDRSGSGRMGTTMVLLLVYDNHIAVAHVGDSRLYCLSRRRGLEQVTADHDVGQREIQRGVEPTIAYARPDAYQLTQALGPRDENFINPDVQFMDLNEDSLLLLCSDGLTDNDFLETHWRTYLEPLLSSQTNLERGVNQLIDLANQFNGHDNITALAVRLKVRPDLGALKR
ncbi:MAG: serine/threonine phosphatase [Leptolyngbyaceae bacterium]|nr:serine/threonine phosphatase [Leptolyngbyaceae bacterium]